MEQNVWPVRMQPKPRRQRLKVHANAESAYRSRRVAKHRVGHDLSEFHLELSLRDSGRCNNLLHTPSALL